jgi:hypothetical protein
VNAAGEWTFASNTLTYWTGTAAQPVTLVGVTSVVADGSSVLKISY